MSNGCDSVNNMNIETYEKIVHIIYEEHNKHVKKWINKQTKSYNLKKTCICDVCFNPDNKKSINEEFKKYMDEYIYTLDSLYSNILERIYKECNIFISGRIKNQDSIILKMYKKSNQDSGKFPIVKCLNDLLGFRIIDSQYSGNIENLIECLDKIKVNGFRIKHLDRINGKYKAHHIYFQGIDNKSFPVELQVWDLKNEKVNLKSHEAYKKEYTMWPYDYKNNLFERGE
ncbi:hypothetical protein ACFIJ5_14305 [Haloimpatiens sp. FM7330]|uniref:hypothetical protein n=1 Tax=Haloimpatiens sp. FM7330 TaxID=3298610 RepID=UPI00363B9455